MAEYKPPKRRGKPTNRLSIAFDRPIPAILLKPEEWPYLPGPTLLEPDRKPTSEEQQRYHAQSLSMSFERVFAAWELFGLKGPDFDEPFALAHKIFSKIFPGYSLKGRNEVGQSKPARWTWRDPETLAVYVRMLELRVEGVSKRRAWKQSVEETFRGRYAESTYQRRWEGFRREWIAKIIEAIAERPDGPPKALEAAREFAAFLKKTTPAK